MSQIEKNDRRMTNAQHLGTVILIIVCSVGMFLAGYKQGREDYQYDCPENVNFPTQEGHIGGEPHLKHECKK